MLSRREFITKCSALVAVFPFMGWVTQSKKYGYISLKTHPEYFMWHVTLDGKDISSDCFAADDERGLAWCYAKRNGKIIVEVLNSTGHVVRELGEDSSGYWRNVEAGETSSRAKSEIRRGQIVFIPSDL